MENVREEYEEFIFDPVIRRKSRIKEFTAVLIHETLEKRLETVKERIKKLRDEVYNLEVEKEKIEDLLEKKLQHVPF